VTDAKKKTILSSDDLQRASRLLSVRRMQSERILAGLKLADALIARRANKLERALSKSPADNTSELKRAQLALNKEAMEVLTARIERHTARRKRMNEVLMQATSADVVPEVVKARDESGELSVAWSEAQQVFAAAATTVATGATAKPEAQAAKPVAEATQPASKPKPTPGETPPIVVQPEISVTIVEEAVIEAQKPAAATTKSVTKKKKS
jgi:hypothetical protein